MTVIWNCAFETFHTFAFETTSCIHALSVNEKSIQDDYGILLPKLHVFAIGFHCLRCCYTWIVCERVAIMQCLSSTSPGIHFWFTFIDILNSGFSGWGHRKDQLTNGSPIGPMQIKYLILDIRSFKGWVYVQMIATGPWLSVLNFIFVQFHFDVQNMIFCFNMKKTLRMKISHLPWLILDETLSYKNSRRKT